MNNYKNNPNIDLNKLDKSLKHNENDATLNVEDKNIINMRFEKVNPLETEKYKDNK